MIDTLNMNLGLLEAGDIDLLSEVPCRFDDEPQEHYYPDGTGGNILLSVVIWAVST